ncbi:MAG: reductive dehalogenase [Bauldia litoralis]
MNNQTSIQNAPAEAGHEPAAHPFDRAAGIEVTDAFERFDQRDDIYSRALWDDEIRSKAASDFYKTHRMMMPRRGDGFRHRDYALRNAGWVGALTFSERGAATQIREGFQDPFVSCYPPSELKREVESPEAMTAEIKRLARTFGAELVGITDYDPRWTYSGKFNFFTRESEPLDLPEGLTSAIVLGFAMDKDLIDTTPSALASAAVSLGYSRDAIATASLAEYISNSGYNAVANMNDTALAVPYAIKAGLAEYGRSNLAITKEYGPRVRFAKIFTDLPLVHDKPASFGVREFCEVCRRCAEDCPSKALPFGEPTVEPFNRSTIKGVRKWSMNAERCFGYWTKIKSDCAVCIRVCPYNKDFSKWYFRAGRWLAGTRFRRLALWLDVKLGYGKRRQPKVWWGDPGTEKKT